MEGPGLSGAWPAWASVCCWEKREGGAEWDGIFGPRKLTWLLGGTQILGDRFPAREGSQGGDACSHPGRRYWWLNLGAGGKRSMDREKLGGILGLAEGPWEGMFRREIPSQMYTVQGFVPHCSALTREQSSHLTYCPFPCRTVQEDDFHFLSEESGPNQESRTWACTRLKLHGTSDTGSGNKGTWVQIPAWLVRSWTTLVPHQGSEVRPAPNLA